MLYTLIIQDDSLILNLITKMGISREQLLATVEEGLKVVQKYRADKSTLAMI